jgi:hypothetical protein
MLRINAFDKDEAALVDEIRKYVRAFLAGRVVLTLRKRSCVGRVCVWLEDGRGQTHRYRRAPRVPGRSRPPMGDVMPTGPCGGDRYQAYRVASPDT